MSIALRDAPRGGQDDARLDFDEQHFATNVSKTADSRAGACGHEHLRVTEQPKNCGEVTP